MADPNPPKAKILVVDDTPANRLAYEALLSQSGFSVVVAESGLQALEIAARDDFALVLLDVKMPELDGYDTAQRLLPLVGRKGTRIVLMSAYDTPSWGEAQLARKGISGFFTTPMDAALFQSRVTELIDHYPRGKDNPASLPA